MSSDENNNCFAVSAMGLNAMDVARSLKSQKSERCSVLLQPFLGLLGTLPECPLALSLEP